METLTLGHVTLPSGRLVLLDAGSLALWSHARDPGADRPPAVDVAIEGPDARKLGNLLGRGGHPAWILDVPTELLPSMLEDAKALARTHGLDAHLTLLAARVPHLQRALNVLTSDGGGQVDFHGLAAVVLDGLPTSERMVVHGEQREERWKWVALDVKPGVAARTEGLGLVAVDAARLMFADLTALGSWNHDAPVDGLADVVFWGRDDAGVAREVGAPSIPEGYGWTNLPLAEAQARHQKIAALRSDERLFAVDFRPHSDHFQLMKQVRDSATGSGTVTVAGAQMCGFMTTWGDGWFPVERDVDADGRTLRVRVLLGLDDRA